MKSLFNTTIYSIDECFNNDIELNSINGQYDTEQNEKFLYETLPEQFIYQIKEKDSLSEEESLKIFPNNNLAKDSPDYQIKFVSNKHSPPFVILGEKKRGRQSEKSKKPKHICTDFDNLQRKIQVHFFTFIINLSNDAIKAVLGSNTPYNFKQIDYQLKILISHKNVSYLHKLAIKDILKMRISPRNKKYSYFINNDTLNAVCHLSKLLENFFDIKYLEFFNDFYFDEEKETNKVIFEGKEIPFSKETKNFYHLLKKYENYKTLLIDSAKSVYFYGYDALIRNNSFVTSKDIELNEWDN